VTEPKRLPAFLQRTDLRLLLFGGKGGVGKTTCAAAAALSLAGDFPQHSFLVVSIDPAHSLRDSFAGPSPLPNLEIREIDSGDSLRKFKEANLQHLRQIALRGTFLDQDDITKLLDLSIPGLDEIMAYIEISDLVRSGAWSCVVVDTAPAGHTLRFLELPRVLREWLEALDVMLAKYRYMVKLYSGLYRKDQTDVFLEELAGSIERVASLLKDPTRCGFVPVMIAEVLSIAETQHLLEKLEAKEVPVSDILVNLLRPTRQDCPTCLNTRARQYTELEGFRRRFSAYPLWEIPIQGAEVRGSERLAAFWTDVRPLADSPEETALVIPEAPRADGCVDLPGPDVSLLLFAGKGGVGKTTLASATAFRLAREYVGREVLLCSIDPAHSLSDCLGTYVGPHEVRLTCGLSAMEIDAEAEFKDLKTRYADDVAAFFGSLTGKTTVDLAFDREVIQRLMDLSPSGLDEVMAFTRVMELMERGKYDIFVLDTAPTGHLIRLLELPELIQDWLRVFFALLLKYKNVFQLQGISELLVGLSKRTKALRCLLADPQRAEVCAVSILTEMAFEETCDLLAFCRRTGIRVSALFLNLAASRAECPTCRTLAEGESKVRRRFQDSFTDIPQTLVYRWGEPRGPDGLAELGQAIYLNSETGTTVSAVDSSGSDAWVGYHG